MMRVDMPKFPGVILPFIAAFLSACSFSLAADVIPPPGSELPAAVQPTQAVAASPVFPLVPPDLQNGQKLYNQECSQCHGVQGMGDGPQAAQLSVPVAALGLSDFARQYSPAEWYTIVTQGNMEKFMPAFANLTDRQRWDVVAYAMSLSAPDSLVSQGKSLYAQKCVTCHGNTGNGDGPDASTLSTAPKNFADQAFMAQSSLASLYQAISTGITPDMPAYTGTLDDNARWALTAYLRSLTFAVQQSNADAYPAPSAITTATPTSNAYPAAAASLNPVLTQTPPLSSTAEITPTVTFLGSVTVQLINGSGGVAPSDAPVTLYGFDNMQNTYSETLTTGENGVYTFTNIIMPTGRVFLAGADYASGTYGSDIATVDPNTPNLNLQVTVYDSSTDVSLLTADRVHIFFDFTDPRNVQVTEVFIISNPTKQAIVAPTQDGTVVPFPLPQGYSNLQFEEGELGIRYVEGTQGFADKMTVNPGEANYRVIFAFQLPYDHKLNFVQPMFLPTSAVVVVMPDNGVKVDSTMLQDGGTQDISGSTYRLYNSSSLIGGSSLEFTLSGNPKKSAPSIFTQGTIQSLAIGLGVFGLVLVLVGLWLFRRYRRKLALQRSMDGTDMAASPIEVYATTEDEGTLMDAIIALDDQYHAGNLPEEAYLERRAVLKGKLRELEQE